MSSVPTPYTRQANFVTDAQGNANITVSQIATELDAEFVAVKTSMDTTQSRLAELQRDDGGLKPSIVGVSSLAADTLSLIASDSKVFRGNWVTGTAYAVGDAAVQSGAVYYCAEAHTSGTFATDLTSGYWAVATAIGDNSVTTNKIADTNVTTAKIANLAVTTGKIANNAVGVQQLATTLDLTSNSVTLPANCVTTGAIADGAVATADLANNAVTTAKLGTNEQKAIAKAWVSFDATKNAAGTTDSTNTTRYILDSYGVSSVTKTATGQYTVTMSTACQNNAYCVVCNSSSGNIGSLNTATRTTTAFGVLSYYNGTYIDTALNSVIVFGS